MSKTHVCELTNGNRERQAAGSDFYTKKRVNGEIQTKKGTHNTINSIFHISYSHSQYRRPLRLYAFAWEHVSTSHYSRCNCICVCWRVCNCMCVRMRVYADKLKIINNHVNEKRKRRRTSSWQAQRIILCLLYFNSEKQTQYYDICGFSCCCCIAFYEENHYTDADASVCFFLSVSFFFHLVCFCCFSLAVEPQAQMTATARVNDGLVGIKFFVIPCVHYHIFRFSSWWIFDACRHCTSVSWHQNVLNVLYDRAQLLANGKLFFLLFFFGKKH